jgi:hypothetical protein
MEAFVGNLAAGVVFAYVLAIVVGAFGWVANVVDVIHLAVANSPLTAMFVLRIAGIVFAPLGAVLGWF